MISFAMVRTRERTEAGRVTAALLTAERQGSLGFLTLFSVEDFRRHLTRVLAGDFSLSLRARLVRAAPLCHSARPDTHARAQSCRVVRAHEEVTPEDVFAPSCRTLKVPCAILCLAPSCASRHPAARSECCVSRRLLRLRAQVLNEVVVDRGAASSIVNLDCYCNGKHVTKVQADGIIVATPTGSTAYSLSAGGSIVRAHAGAPTRLSLLALICRCARARRQVHPSVLAMLFTPISPHSLSFRPLMFSDNALLKIAVPLDRCAAVTVLPLRCCADAASLTPLCHPGQPLLCARCFGWAQPLRTGAR